MQIWQIAVSKTGIHFNVNAVFTGIGISIIKVKWPHSHLISISRIPLLVRRHLFKHKKPSYSTWVIKMVECCANIDIWFCQYLIHWGRVMHICVSDLPDIGSDNGDKPSPRPMLTQINVAICHHGLEIISGKSPWSEFREKLVISFKVWD